MDNLTDSLTVAEYFAGIGLVRMGLESWGWRVIFANDISDKKYEMYKVFFSDADQHLYSAIFLILMLPMSLKLSSQRVRFPVLTYQ